ncbi:MAG: serine protease [Caldilineaceae bacterium]|nr:serine protease [Caldilineaceae bacterium]MDE0501397.1 serine protease [bacterium]
MITSNVIHRTFHIRYGAKSGTAFAIDRSNRQYLITARHVVPDIVDDDILHIFHEKQWKMVEVKVVGTGEGGIDVAVLACLVRLAPSLPLEASVAGLTYGQDVYFLGFPFGWDAGAENINLNFPLPFVKSGIASAITFDDPAHIYVDAHGNPGFSGGPLVFKDPQGGPTEFSVAGIVSNAPTPLLTPVVNSAGKPVDTLGGSGAFLAENQGFVVAIGIRHATEIIDANPVGFELPEDEAK